MSQLHVPLNLLLNPDQAVEPHRNGQTVSVMIDTRLNAPNNPKCVSENIFNVRVHPVFKYGVFQVPI